MRMENSAAFATSTCRVCGNHITVRRPVAGAAQSKWAHSAFAMDNDHDAAPRRCTAPSGMSGSPQCVLVEGHGGYHTAVWDGDPAMRWQP